MTASTPTLKANHQTLPQTVAPSRQQIPAKTPASPRRPSGKLKAALDYMIWGDPAVGDGLALVWDEAARRAGLRVRAMRLAIEKAHVRRYLNEQRQVFCTQASAANISRAVAIRDQVENKMAAVQAMKFIEDVATERVADKPGRVTTPGIQIIINPGRSDRLLHDPGIIEVNPMDDGDAVGTTDE